MEFRGLKPSSCKRYLTCIRQFSNWRAQASQDGPVLETTERDVRLYLQACKALGNGNQRRNFKLCALQAFFRYLIHSRIIALDPTAGIDRPDSGNDPLYSFTRAEVLQLFSAIDSSTEKGLRDVVFLVMGVFAGLRVAEITDLNTGQIADDGRCVSLNIVKNNTGGNRTVALWEEPSTIVRSLLSARLVQGAKKGDPLLVSYKKNGQPRGNQRLTAKACYNLVINLAGRAGMQKPMASTHMLRARHVLDLQCIHGFDVQEIMKRMGFVRLDSVARYFTQRDTSIQKNESLSDYWVDFNKMSMSRKCVADE